MRRSWKYSIGSRDWLVRRFFALSGDGTTRQGPRITAVGHRDIRKSDCVGSTWDEGYETWRRSVPVSSGIPTGGMNVGCGGGTR